MYRGGATHSSANRQIVISVGKLDWLKITTEETKIDFLKLNSNRKIEFKPNITNSMHQRTTHAAMQILSNTAVSSLNIIVKKHNIIEIIISCCCCCCCCCLLLFSNKRGNKVGFPLANFSREATVFLCRYHLLRQQDVAKWMPTKEKGRFARKNSLVENRRNRG